MAPTSDLKQFLVSKPCHPAGGENGVGKLSQIGETSKGYIVGLCFYVLTLIRIKSGESHGRGEAEPAATPFNISEDQRLALVRERLN